MNRSLFRMSDESNLSVLTLRQRKLVEGAVAYNALIQPGRTLAYKVYLGGNWLYPCLTDISTLDGSLTAKAGLEPVCEFSATSLIDGQSEFSPHYYFDDVPVVDSGVRYLALTSDEEHDDDLMFNRDYTFAEKLYRDLETRHPVLLDDIREFNRRRRLNEGNKEITPVKMPSYETANAISNRPVVPIEPGQRVPNAPEAVIVAMHWLQAGGAERWAMETIRLVREAGMLPIVITSINSHNPWVTSDTLEGAIVVNLTFPAQERLGDEPFLRALFEQFDIRGILIHHSQWMYDRLWWVKNYYPNVPVVDSLHIVEHRWHGGYPAEAVAHDRFVDVHHVISPQLVDWMTKVHGVDPKKVVDAPLIDLTANTGSLACKDRVEPDDRFVLAFVGRVSRQKRPDAFIALARLLEKKHPGRFRFILHGSGDIDAVVERMIERFNLQDVVERRSMDVPVSATYADSDALVISSVNEGITLTTFESVSFGVPVLSTDVGSQRTVIPSEALLGSSTREFLGKAGKLALKMNEDDGFRRSVWQEERRLIEDFSQLETANSFFTRLIRGWK